MAGKSTMRSEPDSMPRPSGQGNSARKHAAEEIRCAQGEGAKHTESCGKYGKAESRLPGKASSTTRIGPYRKWTHMGKERILR